MKIRGHVSKFLALGVVFAISGTAFGQVFTQAPGAVTGIASEGRGQGLYGGFGLNSATAPEYNVYRKYFAPGDDFELSSATNVDGNAGEAAWINVNQRQGVTDGPLHVLTAPGMFIGQNNHVNEDGWVTSSPDELLYFK